MKEYGENWTMKSKVSWKSIVAGVLEIIFQSEKVLKFKTVFDQYKKKREALIYKY